MKKALACAAVFLTVVFLGIQLVPVDRSNPPVLADLVAPPEVKAVLKRSCYDCHSNETQWPWYSRVAPVSWLVAHDVEEGREELNFSNWARHANDPEIREEIVEEIEEGEMPMKAYIVTHPKAKISKDDLALLRVWAHGADAGSNEKDCGSCK